jgi:hypothetical protein
MPTRAVSIGIRLTAMALFLAGVGLLGWFVASQFVGRRLPRRRGWNRK